MGPRSSIAFGSGTDACAEQTSPELMRALSNTRQVLKLAEQIHHGLMRTMSIWVRN